jgi:hypothetical protein
MFCDIIPPMIGSDIAQIDRRLSRLGNSDRSCPVKVLMGAPEPGYGIGGLLAGSWMTDWIAGMPIAGHS